MSRQCCMNVIHTTLESWRRKFHWEEPIMSLHKRTFLQQYPYTTRAELPCKSPQGTPAYRLGRTARVPMRQLSSVASRRAGDQPYRASPGFYRPLIERFAALMGGVAHTPSGPVSCNLSSSGEKSRTNLWRSMFD